MSGCIPCEKLKYSVDILLVDEQGTPIPNVPYRLYDGASEASLALKGDKASIPPREGISDGDGRIVQTELPAGSLRLVLDAARLAKVLEEPDRYLRLSRRLEDSAVRQQALAEGRAYRYARLGDLVATMPHIPDWHEATPPAYHFPKGGEVLRGLPLGFLPTSNGVFKLTIEVCPFRAWVLALNHTPEYDLGNAYNLALMSVLTYAKGGDKPGRDSASGSIDDFFNRQLQDLSCLPRHLNTNEFPLLVKDVPFHSRYSPPVFIDASAVKGDFNFPFDTQFFYVERDEELLVCWRGTESKFDALTDLSFRPVPCPPQMACQGKVHDGFYHQFRAVEQHPKQEIREVYETISRSIQKKKLYICGHSLGGALALIHAATLKNEGHDPLLYSYGMPRTFTEAAVAELAFTHYRHLNEDDPVPAVPPGRGFDNPLFDVPVLGYALAPIHAPVSLLTPDMDPYQHHGQVVHFYQTQVSYEVPIGRGESHYPVLLPQQTKLYLVPALAQQECQRLEEQERQAQEAKQCQALRRALPTHDNPAMRAGIAPAAHRSAEYARYIYGRLAGLLASDDPNTTQNSAYLRALTDYMPQLPSEVSQRENALLQLDSRLAQTLPPADGIPLQRGLRRLEQAQAPTNN
ncbi:lipase family protein [Pseudaeromonas paramecii]